MPTYDYRCANGHTFELFHGIKDDTPRVCPECGAPARRVPAGGGGLLFRGSGFHVTDYRSDAYRKAARADGGSGPASPPGPGGAGPAKTGGAGAGESKGGAGGSKPSGA